MRSSTSRPGALQKTTKATRVDKYACNKPAKSTLILRSLQKYFWYTSRSGLDQLALSLPNSAHFLVVQASAYIFSPTRFARDQYPFALPTGPFWPPKAARDLLFSTKVEEDGCIGATRFKNTPSNSSSCNHILKYWQAEVAHWQDHFELRETQDRGLGIYTKSCFRKGDVLGWYAGEIVSSEVDIMTDYVMQMPISAPLSPQLSPCMSNISSYSDEDNEELRSSPRTRNQSPTTNNAAEAGVWIDGNRSGNWTRFINHSCRPHSGFQVCRVGDVCVIAVVALRKVPKNVELTAGYSPDYCR